VPTYSGASLFKPTNVCLWGVVEHKKFVKSDRRSLTQLPPTLLNRTADMKSCEEWKPFIIMVAINFAFAVVNILLKKVLEEGINHLVLVTYRLSISTMFLAPIGYFLER
jgi:hypothetical protein